MVLFRIATVCAYFFCLHSIFTQSLAQSRSLAKVPMFVWAVGTDLPVKGDCFSFFLSLSLSPSLSFFPLCLYSSRFLTRTVSRRSSRTRQSRSTQSLPRRNMKGFPSPKGADYCVNSIAWGHEKKPREEKTNKVKSNAKVTTAQRSFKK